MKNESNIKIIDNFLPEYDWQFVYDSIMKNGDFPWYYSAYTIDLEPDAPSFQFEHKFYRNIGITSGYLNLISPILDKISADGYLRIKANLQTRGTHNNPEGFHTDYEHGEHNTAIYYLNSNNGLTYFENGPTVESVANRFVVFKSSMVHSGSSCTDEKIRVLINFNYVNGLSYN